MTHFRHAAIAAVMLAGASTASAQTTVITRDPVETRTIVQQPVQTETVVRGQPLVLTPVQRRTIYRTIVRERVQPMPPAVEYRVGARVPGSATLYPVPDTIAVAVPAVRPYKYMVVNGEVVLIDPATGVVVAELAD